MKCPNCGADLNNNSKYCEYCGSGVTTQMRREQEQLNKAECPKCGSTNITFNREKQGELKGKRGTAVVRSTVGMCKDCGYTWHTDSSIQTPKKRKTWLWVLGWICIFPVPLTILMLRKKEMKPVAKYGIIAVAWLIYIIIGMNGSSESTETPSGETAPSTVASSVVVEQSDSSDETIQEVQTPESVVVAFVDKFNTANDEKLEFVEDFTPCDKSSGHYRTEFRLGAFANAVGKSYHLGNAMVDIVSTQNIFGGITYRIYMLSESFDQTLNMVKVASPIMDETLSAEELQKTLDYLSEHKSANGYYYGKLGMVLSGNNLMLKND